MSKQSLARLAVAAVVTPLLMLGFAGAASAAEITPIAEYVDTTVADTEAEIGAVVDALGFEAE
ncbi:hypothetical protein [Actinomycetospora atypica]|uniref:Uncharacterized protein n=1 Tax=Actinomycetospora atypica TaxID=1290095 RepID=A0ABV9YX67_9PSEU